MPGISSGFLVLPAITVFAAGATILCLMRGVDLIAGRLGYGAALALPVLACLVLGGIVSLLFEKRLQATPLILCGGASTLVIAWALLAASRVH